ncbi:leucine-rich repeat-containing protein 66 [Marmota flaviventris]|uniref:leucine-rich repeat-containing protein 66 n=1 Tax=Marmota flaviventris TaxID=93162 RepID=UPI003A897567
MKNFYFRVITIVIGVFFTGTRENPSRKSSILFNSEYQSNKYLLTNCSTGKHELPMDSSQTAATVNVSFSFFRVLLQSHMIKEEWKIKHLDLPDSLIWKMTLSPLTHLHALEILNLSNSAIHSISLDLSSPHSSPKKHQRSSFQNELLFPKVLILQRNKLTDTPKGLWKLKSLQSLDLSFNGILQIGLSDFHNCLQLENLYLKSNKIFKIHPEAFKDLKKLQVVDLSNNALTTVLPMMIIALEFPHLEVDLTDNQWQCDDRVTFFQSFISESWRRKWNILCNKSVGNEKAHLEIPKSRISREIHIPPIDLNHMKSLIRNKAARPQGGASVRFSTLRKEAHTGSDLREIQGQLPRVGRNARDVQASGRKEDASQDLILAICLSVFITFFVAFCLGAFTRPYVDRLWQQRCWHKSPGSDNAYSNEGFYDEIEAAGSTQHPRTDLHQALHVPKLCENQHFFLVTEPSPRATVIPDRTLGSSRKEPGSLQSTEQCRANTGAASRNDNMFPNSSATHFTLCRHPNAHNDELISAAQDHIYRNDILGELNYETVAQEYSPSEHSMGGSAIAGTLRTFSGSTHNHLNELDPSLPREVTASESKMLTHANAQRTGESKEIRGPEQSPLETSGLQIEFSKEMQVSNFISLLSAQQPGSQGAKAEEEHSEIYSASTCIDPRDADLSALMPRWASDLTVTPANEKPVPKGTPFDTQYDLETDYDSDEGSLFTLSSEGSEVIRDMTEEEQHGEESSGATKPLQVENPGMHKDSVMLVESLQDNITFQNILGKYETREDNFENSLISGSDSGLRKTSLESASNINISEDPLTWPRSLGNSPSRAEIPDMSAYDYDIALQETPEWHCSLRDLEFSNMDILPQTPPHSAEDPSDTVERACHEKDLDTCRYEPFVQGIDTAQKDFALKISTGENLKLSQQDSQGGDQDSNQMDTDANKGLYVHLRTQNPENS